MVIRNKMAIILNINKDLSIKKISKDYELISENGQYSKEERKKIISRYVSKDNYRDSSNIKKELAEEFVGKDQDTDGTEIIDKILKGFHLKLLDDIEYLRGEFGDRFILGINKTLKKRHNESGDYSSKLSESYLIPIAQEIGFKDYSQYQRQETSEKNLESKLRERIKC